MAPKLDVYPLLAAAVLFLLHVSYAAADVVVLSNRTDRAIAVTATPVKGPANVVRLPVNESRPVFFTGDLKLRAEQAGNAEEFRVVAGRAYYFARRTDTGALALRQIGLGDKATPLHLGPPSPVARAKRGATATVRVKLLIDEDEPTRRNIWEPRLRKRLAAVSDVFEQHAGIRLEIAAIEQWNSDDRTRDFSRSLKEFEREVDPAPADVAIGFSSQYRVERGRFHLGGTRGTYHSHILIKERAPKVLETERRELLAHELGHFFGAAHSPEPNSVMRPLLTGGQQRYADATIKFDPVNTLLIALVGDEMRRGNVRKLTDLSEATRRRMAEVYAALEPTLPNDPAAGRYRELVAIARKDALVTDVREVADRILAVAAREAAGAAGVTGRDPDQLLQIYVRAAAEAAGQIKSENGPRALVLALGLMVDDTGLLRRLPTTGKIARALENDQQLRRKLQVVGQPAMYGRHDLARHFFISAHLTAAVGTQPARGAGLAKEMLDAQGGSGFSFADMAANRAGIVFATAVISKRLPLSRLADGFETSDFLPPVEKLEEGLDAYDFKQKFGGLGDRRFQAEMRRIEQSIMRLPAYRG